MTHGPCRLLFVTIPEKGHVNPLVGVAQHLVRAGHEVSFFARTDISKQLAAAGVPARCHTPGPAPGSGSGPAAPGSGSGPAAPGPGPGPAAPEGFVTRGEEFARKVRDAPWLRRWIATLLVDTVPPQMEPLRRVVREVRPDVMVADPMVYAAVLVAETESIPWAGVSSSLNPVTPDSWTCELTETARALSGARDELFARAGVRGRFKVCDAISPWLNTVFTTTEYVPRSVSGNDFSFHVGPSLPVGARGDEEPFPFDRLRPDRPVVYMSLGSQIYHHPDLFIAAADALVPAGVQLVVAASDLAVDPAFTRRLPAGVVAVRYAPQLALLDRVDAMISHGGANSVMESLSRGRPMVLVPICNDQPLQARFLEASGAGVALPPERFTARACRDAVLPLLAPASPARERAAAIARSYAAAGGAARTAELVVELARTRTPLRPG
jgi:MGT family glycosyltransferase